MDAERSGADVVAAHMAECTDAKAAIVVDGSADDIIGQLVAAGWTLAERVDRVAGKRIRFLRTPAGVNDQAETTGPVKENAGMNDQQETGYSAQAAEFIAGVERHAALGLPELPDDPAAAAAMRAAGYDVLAEVIELDWPVAIVQLAGEADDDEDTGARHAVSGPQLAAALGVTAAELDAGREFIATMRETPQTGPVLSAFRPVPGPDAEAEAEGREMTVRCLLLVGDQAELVPGDDAGLDLAFNARWPAAAIAAGTGLPLEDLPGKVFRARVTEQDGRVLFSAFTLPG